MKSTHKKNAENISSTKEIYVKNKGHRYFGVNVY